MTHIANARGERISTLDDWRRLAPPREPYQWAEGRSAMELARDWIESDAAERLVALLSTRPELNEIVLRNGVAEKQTSFDEIPSGPRQHDLLVRATTAQGSATIGVEGKADEPFGDALQERLAKASSPRSRLPERLERLTRIFFDATLDDPSLGTLGYQLLAALAGTLADAKLDGSAIAVLLVHEFVTPKTDDRLHAANAKNLNQLLERLGSADHTETADGWLHGPWTIRADGKLPAKTTLFIGKLLTERDRRLPVTAPPA